MAAGLAVGGLDAAAGLEAGAFAAGAFFTGAGVFLMGWESPSSAAAFEEVAALGTGFFVPIGVRFAGGGLVFLVAVEGVVLGAGFSDVSALASAVFFNGAFLTGAFFTGAGFDAGASSVAVFAVDAAFFTGALAELTGFAAGAFGAAGFFAGIALPVVLLMVEFTVSVYPCACVSTLSPASVNVFPYCLA